MSQGGRPAQHDAASSHELELEHVADSKLTDRGKSRSNMPRYHLNASRLSLRSEASQQLVRRRVADDQIFQDSQRVIEPEQGDEERGGGGEERGGGEREKELRGEQMEKLLVTSQMPPSQMQLLVGTLFLDLHDIALIPSVSSASLALYPNESR
eukprot:764098-Hanusia_phi.AAC.2